jgi:hypothetical protein
MLIFVKCRHTKSIPNNAHAFSRLGAGISLERGGVKLATGGLITDQNRGMQIRLQPITS